MSFSDDILSAYLDGELGEETRRAVESAINADHQLARRVARLRSLREGRVSAQSPAAAPRNRRATVVQLAAVRASRAASQQAARKALRRSWGWPEWGALVLVAGVALGRFVLARWQPSWMTDAPPPTVVASRDGMLVAQGRLAWALNQQMGGAMPVENEVRVGLSFLSNEGGYCRTFTLAGASQELSGIACRNSDEWRIPVLVQNVRSQAQSGGYRMGGTEMPTALLEAIDQRIVGGMLDARAELEALRRGWQRNN